MKFLFVIEKESRIWIVCAFALMIIWGVILNSMIASNKTQEEVLSQADLESFYAKTETVKNNYKQFTNYIFDEFINIPKVTSLLQTANTTEKSKKTYLRIQLYKLLKSNCNDMSNLNLSQLHFLLRNGESFLNFNDPAEFGDNLVEAQDSIRIVNTEKKFVSGFEENGITPGSYHIVYPLFSDKEYVGSVEVSITMSTIVDMLHDLDPDMETYYIIDKSVINQLDSDIVQNKYEQSIISEGYYSVKEINASSIHNYTLFTEDERIALTAQANKKYGDLLGKNQSFSFMEKFNGKYYQFRFLLVNNVANVPIGYLISVSHNEQMELIHKNSLLGPIFISIIIILFLVASFILTWSHIKIRKMARIDYLTKIYNRQSFIEIASLERERSIRYQKDFSILFLDIDHFKLLNDQYGHAIGDRILIDLSFLISKNIRKNDTFARWGGEEFIILLPETNMESGFITAEKLNKLVSDHKFLPDEQITVCIGVSTFSGKDQQIIDVINTADQAMYHAKKSGRNGVAKFEDHAENRTILNIIH